MKYWGATTASNLATSSGEGLTLEKLRAVMRSMPKLPELPKYDIYPSLFADKAYEINTTISSPDSDRRMIVAPSAVAWDWYTQLRELGADVRWQPRASDSEHP
jgi:hypothetical protein